MKIADLQPRFDHLWQRLLQLDGRDRARGID